MDIRSAGLGADVLKLFTLGQSPVEDQPQVFNRCLPGNPFAVDQELLWDSLSVGDADGLSQGFFYNPVTTQLCYQNTGLELTRGIASTAI